jgi:ERF superfamily protein
MNDEAHDAETGELPAVIHDHPIAPPSIQPLHPAPLALPITPFDKLAGAIAAVMEEITPVEKHGENKFQNYKFPRMQDVLQVLTPLVSKHGIVIMQSEIERGFMDKGSAIYATYDFTVFHKSGQVWPERQRQTGVSRTRDSKGGFDDKSLNKCHTQARKFFLMALFQIPTEDSDGERRYRPQSSQARTPINSATQVQPPQQQPDQVQPAEAPHELQNSKGETYLAWGERLMQAVLASADAVEVDAWEKANARILGLMKDAKPDIHTNIMHSIKQHRGVLAMK